ncbi:MAG TPA: hypothetical protein VM146_13360 [Steroidobacteraceae bacterium]|nr:hypothetical protein [Steroidobacteraceae bacterium]
MSPQIKSLHDVRKLAGSELSLKSRLGYVALLLVAAGVTVVIASLWITEPSLPLYTQAAFGAMNLIGVSWVALSIWALVARRPLFARDRVIAGGMAVAFTSLFLAGSFAAAIMAGSETAYAVMALAGMMFAMAIKVQARARRRFNELSARRAELEP